MRAEPIVAVTGAAGKTGRAVLAALDRRSTSIRGLVRRDDQARELRAAGVEPIVGDLRDADALGRLLTGVDALYHIAPNVDPTEEDVAREVFAAARAAGDVRVVYHSVLHPQVEAMPHHWRKMRVEEMLFTSDLPFTILQPSAYYQNLLAQRSAVLDRGVLPAPYSPEARFTLVDLDDVAEVAARVLCEDGHSYAIYELAGPEEWSMREIAEEMGRLAARPVRAERLSLEAWEESVRGAGLDAPRLEALKAMFRYYDRAGLRGNGAVLRGLLDGPPRGLGEWIRQEFLGDRR